MHHRHSFWKPFSSERVNESLKLPKSQEKYFDSSFSWFWAKLSLKKLFSIRSQILGLLITTLTGNYEYSRSNRENLPLKIQIELSKIPQTLLLFFFLLIFGIYIKLPMFWKKQKNERDRSNISPVLDSERWAYLNA